MTHARPSPTASNPACLVLIGPSAEHNALLRPVGCGLLVQQRQQLLVLTCAHVVNTALNRAKTSLERPVELVAVRAWRARESEWVVAEVVTNCWIPVDVEGTGDLALLHVVGDVPGEVSAAPLARYSDRAGRRFQCLGFPSGYHGQGQHATGDIIGRFGPRGRFGPEWVQLNGETTTGYRVLQGFSGSPVWDIDDQRVVGLVVGEDVRNPEARVGAMIPLDIVAGYLHEFEIGDEGAGEQFRKNAPFDVDGLLELPPVAGELPRLKEVGPYILGATRSHYASDENGSDPYVLRDCDEQLRIAISTRSFVIVVGPSKAGKSRTAYEASLHVLGEARLVAPRIQVRAMPALAKYVALIPDHDPVLIWLYDLDRFLVPAEGFDVALLGHLVSRRGRTAIVATLRQEKRGQLRQAGELERGIRLILERATQINLDSHLSVAERQRAEQVYPAEKFTQTGIGERLASVPELVALYEEAALVPLALLRAAIDWFRAGMQRSIPEADLKDLAIKYILEHEPDHENVGDDEFAEAIGWASKRVGGERGTVSLLKAERQPDRSLAYRPFDYLIAFDDGQDSRGRPVPEVVYEFVKSRAAPEEALLLARQSEVRAGMPPLNEPVSEIEDLIPQAEGQIVPVVSQGLPVDEQLTSVKVGTTGSIFVSHSSRDRFIAGQFVERLRVEGFSSGLLDFDPDPEAGVPSGREWERELYAALRRADAVVFLASPTSVSSPWNFAEVSLARSLNRPIIPVRLESSVAFPLLGDTQWIDAIGMGEQVTENAVARLVEGLRRAGIDPGDTFYWDPARSPYPGLAPFDVEDAAVFFGRDREVGQLLELLRPTLARGGGRFVGLVGPSGSGKSSLLRAGLLPRLVRQRERWLVSPPFFPGTMPIRSLARSLTDAFAANGHERPISELAAILSEGAAGLGMLISELQALSMTGSGRPNVLLVIDQAEELITRAGQREQQYFLNMLRQALRENDSIWIVATVRSEFLSTTPGRAGLAEAVDDPVVIEPLSRSRLAEVIARPAQRAGLTFVPGLVERVVDDTAGGDALPLLAYTLRELALRAGPSGRITITDYEAIGGVVGALRYSADRLAEELSRSGHRKSIIPTLTQFASVTRDEEPTRRRVPRSAFTSEEQVVVDAFVDARLLISGYVAASPERESPASVQQIVEVAHEALLRQWPPLREAVEANRARLQLRSELSGLAADWEYGSRDDSYLLRAGRLAAFDSSISGDDLGLGTMEHQYLQASRAAAARELQAVRRVNRRLRVLAVGIFILLLISIISTTVALRALQEVQRLRGY